MKTGKDAGGFVVEEPTARPSDRPTATLVVQTAFLGDVVLTTPLLTALAERHGPVDVVVTPGAASLLEGHPAVREVVRYDKNGGDAGLGGLRRLGSALRARGYARAYLPHRSWRSAALALLARVPERTGFADSPAAITYTTRVPRAGAGHEVERLLALAGRRAGGTPPVSLALGPGDESAAERWLAERGVPAGFTAVAPGSIWGTKRWPYYPALAAMIERQNLEQVVRAAERASALTQQLLTFSRRQITEIRMLDLNDLVTGLETLLRRLIGEHITLQITPAHDLGRVRGNQAQLEQVLMNLVLNARDAMPKGGLLSIATRNVEISDLMGREQLRLNPGPYVMVSVSDTGMGMDAVTQASIFEPFFTTKPPGEGTGLGLSTVYAIVQQSGGAIYVYSEPEVGTTFKVYFPRVDVPVESHADAEAVTRLVDELPTLGAVLVVEDEPSVRGFAGQVLSQAGYRVLEAATGEEALAFASVPGETIAAVLTDVVMPGINGRVLAERLRALHPGIAVLYMSGYTEDMVLRTGVVTDAANFIQKPFTPEGLLARLRSALAPLLPHLVR